MLRDTDMFPRTDLFAYLCVSAMKQYDIPNEIMKRKKYEIMSLYNN